MEVVSMTKEMKMYIDLYIEKFGEIPMMPYGSNYSQAEQLEMIKQCIITNKPLTFDESDNEGIVRD